MNDILADRALDDIVPASPLIEPTHSPFGGSVAACVLHCPASVGLVAKAPQHSQPPSAFSNRGTALHTAMTLLIKNTRPLNAFFGSNINNYVITRADLANALLPTYAYVKQLFAPPGTEYCLEQRVVFPTIADAFGTLDLLARIGSTVHVTDYKFGLNTRVRAHYGNRVSPQLMFYASAGRHTLPKFFADAKNIVLTIVQPMSTELVSSVAVTHAELDTFVVAYHAVCQEALGPAPRLRAGSWCKFCPARPICPAHTAPSGRCRPSAEPWNSSIATL